MVKVKNLARKKKQNQPNLVLKGSTTSNKGYTDVWGKIYVHFD